MSPHRGSGGETTLANRPLELTSEPRDLQVLANINLGTDSLDLINFSVFLDHPRQFHSVPPPRSLVSKRWDAAYPGTVTAVLLVFGRLSINGLDWGIGASQGTSV